MAESGALCGISAFAGFVLESLRAEAKYPELKNHHGSMYIDLLTKIKNAQGAKKESLKVHFSKMDMAILEILAARGYIDSAQKKGRMPKRIIDIKLKYNEGVGRLKGIKFISKPSRRIYVGYSGIKKVKQGTGISLISTTKGIMSNYDARKAKVGGEMLFEIW